MATKYEDLLDGTPSEDDRPKTLPVGSYLTIIKGLPEHGKSKEKQTPFVKFTHIITAIGSDIDEDKIAEYGGADKLIGKKIENTFYLTENSVFMLNEFLGACGIEGGRSRREMIDETPNCEVVVYIRHEASQDGQRIFARVGKAASADEFNKEAA